MGLYECVCGEYNQHVNLQVLVPTEISAHVGGNVTLACHGSTNKMTKDSEIYVQWIKDGQNVSTISAGNITYGSGYKDRVSVSMDGYRKGDIFLNLTDLRLSDQGTYWCFFGPDHQRGNPGAVILTITPKEKHNDNTGMPTSVKVVVLLALLPMVLIDLPLPQALLSMVLIDLPLPQALLPMVLNDLPLPLALLPRLLPDLPLPQALLPMVLNDLPLPQALLPRLLMDLPLPQALLPRLLMDLPLPQALLPRLLMNLPIISIS
uniref:Ig-like domain-containing protein n=1 Tax=Oncorhynchus kisutch TaxID=8019 RepID=A0A8C7IHJ4_ONCKI